MRTASGKLNVQIIGADEAVKQVVEEMKALESEVTVVAVVPLEKGAMETSDTFLNWLNATLEMGGETEGGLESAFTAIAVAVEESLKKSEIPPQ